MKKIFKIFTIIGLVMLMLSCAGCSKSSKEKVSDIQATEANNNVQDNNNTQNEFNPLGLSEELYEKYNEEKILDDKGNVKYLGSLLLEDDSPDKKRYVDISIHKYDDKHLLIEYIYASEHDLEEGVGLERHLVLYDRSTNKQLKEIVVKLDEAHIEKRAECILILSTNDNKYTVKTYDFELNEIAEYVTSEDENSVSVTSDGKRMYYVKKHRLCVFDSEENVSKEFESNNEFAVHGVTNVLTDKAGNDYVMFSGMAADYNTYNFIYDTFNSTLVCASLQDISYEIYDGFVIRSNYLEEMDHLSWVVGVSDSKAFYYNISEEMQIKSKEGELVQLLVLNNGDLLFNTSDGENVYVEVYDSQTGDIIASTTIPVADIRREPLTPVSGMEAEYYTDNMMIFDKTFYLSDNVMLLTLNDFYGTEYYLRWQMEDDNDNQMLVVSDYEIGTDLQVDISEFDNEILLPGEVSDELIPLKEQADRLEEEYNIEINIGDECADVCEMYLIHPLNDYEKVKVALEELETALGKYPDNFFSQFKYEGIDGIEVNISAELIGIKDEALDVAGGYKCIEGGKIKLVIDCYGADGVNSTFHHELCHAIEEVILYKQVYMAESMFDELTWNEFNPYEDMYSYNYEDWGKEEYWCYAYGMTEENDAYFIDTYAMTYPTEDRARIFEYIMREDGYIDFEKSPYIIEKLNYYAECIRYTFDTTGWENVPWEAHME